MGDGAVTRLDALSRLLRRERVQVLLLALAVAIPVVVTGLRVAGSGWVPAIDDATIATRAYDVFSRHPPLVGQYSLAGEVAKESAHSPGPVPYWLVAVPARFAPSWTIPVLIATVNAALLALVVVLARRRLGMRFAWVVAAALVFLVRAYGPVTQAEIWNPWLALTPFAALGFVAWSVADGDRGLLPLGVALACLVMQAHLTYVAPAAGLVLVAVVGGWGSERLGLTPRPGRDGPSSDPGRAGPRGWLHGRRWPLVASVMVGAACWALPIYEQLTRDPGNLTLVARAGRVEGARGGLDAVRGSLWRALGLPPGFARSETDPAAEVVHGLGRPGTIGTVITVLFLVALTVTAWSIIRTRERSSVTGLAVVATMLGGLVFVAASLPLSRSMVAAYSFRWFALAGLSAWLLVGLVGFRALGLLARTRRARASSASGAPPGRRLPAPAPMLVVAGVAMVGAAGLAVPTPDSAAWSYRPAKQVGDLVESATKPGGTYLIARTDQFDIAFAPALAWRLRTTGRHPVLRPPHREAFGDAYRASGQRCDALIALVPDTEKASPDVQVVGTVRLPGAPDHPPAMRLQLAPDRSPGGRC